MFNFISKKKTEQKPEQPKRKGLFSTDVEMPYNQSKSVFVTLSEKLKGMQPVASGNYAQDDSETGVPLFKSWYTNGANSVSNGVIDWYAGQSFIGWQLSGMIAQHWLVNKACSMPAQDAVRKGYAVATTDGDELSEEEMKALKKFDKKYRINHHMREFIRKGRIFGIRVAMFKVESTDPEYYEKPFNLDGIAKKSYKGIVQIDPYWMAPQLDQAAAGDPSSMHFYEPTFWIIRGQKVHRSHLIIYRYSDPVDILKPLYIYGGIPLPQLLMERIYAAERTANEAPQLAMTKRTDVWLTDMEAAMADTNETKERMNFWSQFRDNYAIKLGDKEGDEFQRHDTSLADLDNVIMTQYQLVAAIANVPATKLLGTQPKGFNSTGDYETQSYHESLESLQENDLTPFLERHHALVLKSEVGSDTETTVTWNPLDTPTAQELAQTNFIKAQTGYQLVTSGAIDGEDERTRIATDKNSGYHDMGLEERELDFSDEGGQEDVSEE